MVKWNANFPVSFYSSMMIFRLISGMGSVSYSLEKSNRLPSLSQFRSKDMIRLAVAGACSVMIHLALALGGGTFQSAGIWEGASHRVFGVIQVQLPEGPRSQRQPIPTIVDVNYAPSDGVADQPATASNSVQGESITPSENKFPILRPPILPVENADQRYFTADDLTQRAKVIRDIPEDSPAMMHLLGQGKIVLALFINEKGGIDRVEVVSSEVSEQLTQEVIQEFESALFSPAELDGKVVRSLMRVHVRINPL